MYTIKETPEDFVVFELPLLQLDNKGPYLIARMEKKNYNTLDAIKTLAKALHIKDKDIGFAGSKDRNAITTQYISIKGITKNKLEKIELKDIQLEFVGFHSEPLTLGDLAGNRFEIIVKNLDEPHLTHITHVVNYFDEQRFSKTNVEVGRALIKKDFAKATQLLELPVLRNDYIGALKQVPIRLLRLFTHAYQSWLWNQTAELYLRKHAKVNLEIEYSKGTFVFVEKPESHVMDIPLVGFATEHHNTDVEAIIKYLMTQENLKPKDFVVKQIPQISLEGSTRPLITPVIEFQPLTVEPTQAKVTFSLPKGSYATIVIRRLFTEFAAS